jgi:HlyD family secretion protein
MPVTISIGAIPNARIDAEIEYITNKGIKESGSVLYEIKAALKVTEATLIRANYSANAAIVIERVNDVIKIPESSVEFSNNGLTYVYKLKNNNVQRQVFLKQLIEIGLYDGNYVEVKSGLSLNDKIRGREMTNRSK